MILLTSAPVSARLGVPSTKKHAPRVGGLRRRGSNVRRERLYLLRIALIVFGLTPVFGIYSLVLLWPSGWAWGLGHTHYLIL